MSALANVVSDTAVLAKRNLLRIPRAPDLLLGYTIQPVMFVLLFAYVFGGAIAVPAVYDGYVDFLMPGIIVQTIAFGGFVTALSLSDDLKKGLIDRFRSLPMTQPAVLVGRTISDIALNALSLAVLLSVGLAIGFRFDAPVLEILAGVALMLALGYAFSWGFVLVALVTSTAEAGQAVAFIVVLPLTFASSAFVPVESMPGWLEAFAEVNPITLAVDALRALFLDAPAGNAIWGTLAWTVGLTVGFATLAIARYRRAVLR